MKVSSEPFEGIFIFCAFLARYISEKDYTALFALRHPMRCTYIHAM